jgi:RecA-family ATPase
MATRKKKEAPSGETPGATKATREQPTSFANQKQSVIRLALLANGYWPIPITGKATYQTGWQNTVATEAMILGWPQALPDYQNTGILTRTAPAIDIDIKDEAIAGDIEEHLRGYFNGAGRLLRRVGQWPKRAFLFKTDTPFKKLLEEFIAPDGSKHKIEILGDGQQLVVDGIHPDTGKPYTWNDHTPWEVPAAELMLLTKEQARAWLDDATKLLVARGWQHVSPPPRDESGVSLIVQLACKLWGEPTDSNQGQFRFGTHGSKSVDATARPQLWYDFEANEGGVTLDLMQRVKAAGGGDIKPPTLTLLNISNWDTAPVPQQDYSVPDRIPTGHVTLFSGEGAAGKSTIYLQLAIAHGLGRDWLRATTRPGPALFVDAEDGEQTLHERAHKIVKYHGPARFTDLVGKLHLLSLAGEDAVLGAFNRRSGRIEPTPLFGRLLEMAGDLKPVSIGLASSANMFAGNEIDRSQVMQFIGLLTRIAMVANSSVVLISHPSLTGISTDTGISGSTQWHNSVRARFYLKGYKSENDQEPKGNLREIVFLKNNYGPMSSNVVLEYRNGLFLPVDSIQNVDAAVRLAQAKEVFLALVKRFNEQKRNVSANKGPSYAPTLFVKEMEAVHAMLTTTDLANALRALWAENQIMHEEYGRPSHRSYRLVINPEPGVETM